MERLSNKDNPLSGSDPDELTWDKFIYPRGAVSQKTISAYVEALEIGAQFPPIKIQRVFNYTDANGNKITIATIILDGVHRWSAFKEMGIKEIAAVEWKDTSLDYEENKIALLLESAQSNISHGDRLSTNDKKRVARDIALSDPECSVRETALAEKLGVSQQSVNLWISDIRARQRTSRDSTIIRLGRLGWTQDKISDKVGLSRNRVCEIVGNTNIGNIDTLLAQGHDMEYIAAHYQMDLALTWAIRLHGKTDQEKFKELGWGLRTWDQWNFNECDERFGDDWPGRIPAQLIAHTLFYFTKPNDLVLDPMAGGGVVPDTCLLFERKCQAFDLAAQDKQGKRPEIEYHHWDPKKETWPVTKKPDLIFFDPPYYTKKKKEYEQKANEDTPSISSYTKKDYKQFFKDFFTLAYKNAKPTTTLAFLNADWRDFESTPAAEEKPDKAITIFDYHSLLSETGWKTIHRIECPLSSERLTGNQVQKMQDKRILGTIGRTLLIAKKNI
ncbi:MerR family transcriptional regulator [Desulfobacula sp.]|uniref:MerR family transcriptional regulator n=1 Tax=Desulfobacula sp. TaxID=2593537 RepID=UPI0027155371|nr:MerR family transcriptional regulator [Desulfobacula sp.]